MAGSFVDEAPDALLAANPCFLADFSLIIATQACAAPCSHGWPLALHYVAGLLAGSLCCLEIACSSTARNASAHHA